LIFDKKRDKANGAVLMKKKSPPERATASYRSVTKYKIKATGIAP